MSMFSNATDAVFYNCVFNDTSPSHVNVVQFSIFAPTQEILIELRPIRSATSKVQYSHSDQQLLQVFGRLKHIVLSVEESCQRNFILSDEYNEALSTLSPLLERAKEPLASAIDRIRRRGRHTTSPLVHQELIHGTGALIFDRPKSESQVRASVASWCSF
ncbi:hypothetical protein LshimejAT787_0603540 [Lyophyllum shimeji]|uniref:Uncharacterized protein n=1 Tax=Lyophyllum shimeji TaxID=47721 RepID=A0A9P3UNC7_LYOSH|nr:hypothetical protein LshimejAT787_0603540 [Lyophyllum shimeji]